MIAYAPERGLKLRLRDERLRQLMTIRQLAEASGVATSTIVRYEKGEFEQHPNFETLRKLADALGVPARELFLPD